MRGGARGLGLILVLLVPRAAGANALDTFGYSARAAGVAGALTAGAEGYQGAHHNPALVASARHVEVALGYSYASTGLKLDGKDAQVTAPHGFSFGLALPLRFGSITVAFGVALYMPDQFVVRIALAPPAEPHFVLLDQNLHHIVVTPVLALAWRWLSIGAGATVLADAAGQGVTFNVGVIGGEKVGNAQLDVALPTRAAPVVGVAATPLPWLKLGAAYRGQVDLALKLDILAKVDIAGAITGDTLISLRATNFFTPHKVSLGAQVSPARGLYLHGQVEWLGWSQFGSALPDLRTTLSLGLAPALADVLFPRARFHDVWCLRVGAEFQHAATELLTFTGRLGYAFEPTPVPEQTALTNFADNDRHVLAFGAGMIVDHIGRILPKPLSFDVALQLHALAPRLTDKDPRWFPGALFTSSGYLLAFQTTLEARF